MDATDAALVERLMMGLHFRHYKDKWLKRKGLRNWDFKIGIVFYDRKQPTLDILFGKHVFVAFWKRKNR